jgi:hypothetical protein
MRLGGAHIQGAPPTLALPAGQRLRHRQPRRACAAFGRTDSTSTPAVCACSPREASGLDRPSRPRGSYRRKPREYLEGKRRNPSHFLDLPPVHNVSRTWRRDRTSGQQTRYNLPRAKPPRAAIRMLVLRGHLFDLARFITRSAAFEVSRRYYERDWKRQFMQQLESRRVDVVFDVGANSGQYVTDLRRSAYKGASSRSNRSPDRIRFGKNSFNGSALGLPPVCAR